MWVFVEMFDLIERGMGRGGGRKEKGGKRREDVLDKRGV